MNPVLPCSMISETDPQRHAITGVPQAMASISTRPKGSGQSIGNKRALAFPKNADFSLSPICRCFGLPSVREREEDRRRLAPDSTRRWPRCCLYKIDHPTRRRSNAGGLLDMPIENYRLTAGNAACDADCDLLEIEQFPTAFWFRASVNCCGSELRARVRCATVRYGW
jgi:hypothetical protein